MTANDSSDSVYLVVFFPGQHMTLPLRQSEAEKAISQWKDFCSSNRSDIEVTIFAENSYAFRCSAVVGMYIAERDDKPTPAERLASVMEKAAQDGEEWRQ